MKPLYFLILSLLSTTLISSCGVSGVSRSNATAFDLNSARLRKDPNAYRLVNPGNANAMTVMKDPNQRWFILHAAAANNEQKVVKALIKNGADVSVRTSPSKAYPNGATATELANDNDFTDLAKYLAQLSGENLDHIEVRRQRRQIARLKEAGPAIGAMIDRWATRRASSTTCSVCNGDGYARGYNGIVYNTTLKCRSCGGSGRR